MKINAMTLIVRGIPAASHVTIRVRSGDGSIDKRITTKTLNRPLEPRNREVLTLTICDASLNR